MEKEVFIIESYEICKEKEMIIFYGRVIEKVTIGDKLAYRAQETGTKYYNITEIIAYRKKFDSLERGMTGALLVQGEKQDFAKDSILTKTT